MKHTYITHSPSVDVALLRGTYADQQGNIYLTQEAYLSECYHVALNAKANHGKVIVQVKALLTTINQNRMKLLSQEILSIMYTSQKMKRITAK